MYLYLTLLSFLIFLALYYFYQKKKWYKEREELQSKIFETPKKMKADVDTLNSLTTSLINFHRFESRNYDLENGQEFVNRLLVEYAAELMGSKITAFFMFDNRRRKWFVNASKGLPEEIVASSKYMGLDDDVLDMALLRGTPYIIRNVKDYSDNSILKIFSPSFIALPFKVKENTGVLVSINNHNERGEDYAKLMTILVNQVLVTIENLNLYHNIHEMSINTIKTLGRAIDAKSNYTRRHTERVTFYAKEILNRMDLDDATFDRASFSKIIEYGALLHDVGKIGVKEEILDKNGKLTEKEWEIMTMHPLIGERIVSPINYFSNVGPLILYHHERYDGKGYLEGLKGREIPLGARIIAIADAYDAMTSDRAYRKALSVKQARKEIVKESGKQFDPEIVKAFLKYLDEQTLDNQSQKDEEITNK